MDFITIIITSSLVSSIVSTIVTGFIERKKFIFEKSIEAFTNIINQIILLINKIPYPQEIMDYIQISDENYHIFKTETEKNILYLNKKETILLNEITKLFARNVYIEPAIGGDPNDFDYLLFNEEERKKINNLKDELLKSFQKRLGINRIFPIKIL